jgi:hypothetical protein
MSSLSQVGSIFFAALEKKTPDELAKYLDQACGTDAALRHCAERLLKAHPKAADFLAEPAGERPEFDADNVAYETAGGLDVTPTVANTSIVSGAGPAPSEATGVHTPTLGASIPASFDHGRLSIRRPAKRPHRRALHAPRKNRRRGHGRGLGCQTI